MADLDLTRLVFLLDRSGSMRSIQSDIEGGFAAFIDDQRAAAGECTVTLAQFDDRFDVVYRDVDVERRQVARLARGEPGLDAAERRQRRAHRLRQLVRPGAGPHAAMHAQYAAGTPDEQALAAWMQRLQMAPANDAASAIPQGEI